MPAFVPAQFETPTVAPDTASLFRRTPYISTSEYQAAPTAVAIKNLVPGGSEKEQIASLAAVISRASAWVDMICFHRADGTLAASPSTESGWIRPKDNGTLALICNYKPILEVDGMAFGAGPGELSDIGQSAAETLTIEGQIIQFPGALRGRGGPSLAFPERATLNGKVYVVWRYVNGYPHTSLAKEAKAKAKSIEVNPTEPGGEVVYGVYPGTQLTIHDGENTEVIVVEEVEGLKLKLKGELLYAHKPPTVPDTTRVSAIPWTIEQATISLTSNIIKMRGTRSMTIPSSPGTSSTPPKQVTGQPGAQNDFEQAVIMLKPFDVPYLRST